MFAECSPLFCSIEACKNSLFRALESHSLVKDDLVEVDINVRFGIPLAELSFSLVCCLCRLPGEGDFTVPPLAILATPSDRETVNAA